MHRIRPYLAVIALQLVASCSLQEPKPAAPPPTPPPTPAVVVDDLPYRPLPQATPKPAAKARPATTPTSKPGKAAPTKPVAPPPAAGAEEAAPPETELGANSSASARALKKPAPAQAFKGPDWLQYCSARQQSGGVILCDADTLLAQPSAKVQVYVREPALARGQILLRESLPKRYRFFVLP